MRSFGSGKAPFEPHQILLMGIVNVTPDSFYDGGKYATQDSAVEHGLELVEEGCDILDIGGESTRPGAEDVDTETEYRRVIPVVENLRLKIPDEVKISVDTRKSLVADAALHAGANIINDVSGLRNDPRMAEVVATHGCNIILMHMRGSPATMKKHIGYQHLLQEVLDELYDRINFALDNGVEKANIWIDPGIGFAKTAEQSLVLIRHLQRFINLGYPVVLGASRKSFIGELLDFGIGERLEASLAVTAWAAIVGVRVLRVHDIREHRRVVKMLQAILEV